MADMKIEGERNQAVEDGDEVGRVELIPGLSSMGHGVDRKVIQNRSRDPEDRPQKRDDAQAGRGFAQQVFGDLAAAARLAAERRFGGMSDQPWLGQDDLRAEYKRDSSQSIISGARRRHPER